MKAHAVALALSLSIVASSAAQDNRSIEARYTKTEHQIPMRDGKRLFTVVYEPRDTTRRYAVLMTRTPYSVGPYGPTAYPRALGPTPQLADKGSSSSIRTCADASCPRASSCT